MLNQSDYLGRNTAEVQTALRALGLESTVEDGDTAPSADAANTVQSLTPTGSVAPGTVITIREYTAPPIAAASSSTAMTSSAIMASLCASLLVWSRKGPES